MDFHHLYMSEAIEEARKAYTHGEVPVGAVLVDAHGKIISRGGNAPIGQCDPTAHAEIVVLREAARAVRNYRLPGATLYVTLEPCVMCLGAMVQARIRGLVFGAPDPKAGALGGAADLTKLLVFNHYIQVIGGVLADQSADPADGVFPGTPPGVEELGRGTEEAVTGSTRNRLVL